jgi:hypothetical protein
MPINLKRINNEVVKPVKIKTDDDDKPIKGYDMIPELYAKIFLMAKKRSGKTCVIYNLIKKCVDKKKKVIIFCSTLYKDDTYKQMRDYLDKAGIDWEGHTSLNDNDDGTDKLEELVQHLQNEKPKEREEEQEGKKGKKQSIIFCDGSSDEEEQETRSKYRTPEYLIILDDLSTELKSTSLVSLLKKNRHYKAKLIVSSQYWNDLNPASRKQMDNILIFRSIPDNKLKEIYHDADLSIAYDKFVKIYRNATKDPFSFLYIDCNDSSFRRNFNLKYIIDT